MGAIRDRVASLSAVRLSAATLNKLDEYSRSDPTGVTIGKRWRCNVLDGYGVHIHVCGLFFVFPEPPLWVLGEYVASAKRPGAIAIRWSRIEVAEEGQQCATTL